MGGWPEYRPNGKDQGSEFGCLKGDSEYNTGMFTALGVDILSIGLQWSPWGLPHSPLSALYNRLGRILADLPDVDRGAASAVPSADSVCNESCTLWERAVGRDTALWVAFTHAYTLNATGLLGPYFGRSFHPFSGRTVDNRS